MFIGIFIGQVTGFNASIVIKLFIISILSITAFIFTERKAKNPLIDLTIFNNKDFSLGLICAMLIFSSNLFMNTLMPFYLQNTLILSAFISGIILMCVPIAMVVIYNI